GPLERHLLQASQAFLREGCVQLDTPAARHAFDAFAGTLRTVLHNLACALNPELLVIAWPADTGGQLAAALRERWNAPLPLAIQNSELSSDAALQGAAQLALIRLAETMCQTRTGEEHGR
ncbi:MAG TPA: hypothetical protein VF171_07650, partial [Trueperaceae bacterium]